MSKIRHVLSVGFYIFFTIFFFVIFEEKNNCAAILRMQVIRAFLMSEFGLSTRNLEMVKEASEEGSASIAAIMASDESVSGKECKKHNEFFDNNSCKLLLTCHFAAGSFANPATKTISFRMFILATSGASWKTHQCAWAGRVFYYIKRYCNFIYCYEFFMLV